MSNKISGKFHPIPSTIANQRWISIRNIIIFLEIKFRPNRRIFYLVAILYHGCHDNVHHFEFVQPPIAGTYYGGYSYKVDHNMAPKPWISIPNIKIYLETKFRPNQRMFVFWRPFRIQNGRHSKPTMDINSQHHNLLGNQISPKSEDFFILAAILDSKWPP